MSTRLTNKKPLDVQELVYLDCNATTPVEPEVIDRLDAEALHAVGNAGSRTHEFGAKAKRLTENSREKIAKVVKCQRDEVLFTSGATESNNLALLGLRGYGEKTGRKHLISSATEHASVLEPLQHLQDSGFSLTLLAPDCDGRISCEALATSLRPDTLLVSIMHANNETGTVQQIKEIAAVMSGHEAYLHVDAAQGFGKRFGDLEEPRIDLISISGHKIFAPKGVGALITRRRGYNRPPLKPLMFGGGQERGLRPGTLPVELIFALGVASELAFRDRNKRQAYCSRMKAEAIGALRNIGADVNGDPNITLSNTLNVSIPGLDSEAAILALKEIVAISNGSACTSQSYSSSHVLTAMGLSEERVRGALRFSWCHLTPRVPWRDVALALQNLSR